VRILSAIGRLSPDASAVRLRDDNPPRRTEDTMRYALLVYHQPGAMDHLSPEEREATSREFYALRSDPACLDGAQLAPITAASTLRESAGRPLVTDGPFADTKEILGGFYIVEAADLDAATALAEQIPITRFGGAIEIRPLVPVPSPVESAA
jgi:hypothetical protein